MRGRCLIGLLIAAVLAASMVGEPSFADFGDLGEGLRDQPIDLSADLLEYDRERRLYTATGNVVIRQQGRTIRADWLAFSPETGRGVASGKVEIEEDGVILRASFVEFDVYGVEGMVRDGELESTRSNFHGFGREIRKTGENRYHFEDGRFTSCNCPEDEGPQPWVIVADEADVEVGGYGTVRDGSVRVLGIPLVWLPWMIFPVKTERQTGVLLPQLEIGSRNGFGLGLPLFWAAHEQINLTLTPAYTTRRGARGQADLEYVFGSESWGALTGAYGHDTKIDPHSLETPFSRDRWLVDGAQDWRGPGRLRFATQFAFVSDNDVPIDFDPLRDRRADRFLVSTASLGRPFGKAGRFGIAATARFAESLQNPTDIDRDPVLLQRLPGAEAVALPAPLPWLPQVVTTMEGDYAYFRRRSSGLGKRAGALRGPDGNFLDSGIDSLRDALEVLGPNQPLDQAGDPHRDDFTTNGGTEGDGLFQEGEVLIDEGNRLWLHPRLALPFQLGRFAEIYPEVGWNQTVYDTRLHGSDERGFLTARVEVRSRLQRRIGKLVHIIEPRLGWALAYTRDQSGNPLFVPETAVPQLRVRALDLDAVTGDDADRIPRANRLTFGVENRLYHDDGEIEARLTLLALQDFEAHSLSEIVLDGEARGRRGVWTRFHLVFDPDQARMEDGLARLGWDHSAGHRVSAGFRYLRKIPKTFEAFPYADRFDDYRQVDRIEQVDAGFELRLTRNWLFAYRGAYSFDDDLLLSNAARIEYGSSCGCWAAGIEFSSDRAGGLNARVLYRITGFGGDEEWAEGGLLDAL